ncbi:GYF domain-containing protein [Hallella multisaccharivorax]|uniref:GYF domain-containing protein n=1 Tax=Hallella multisaccharivorax TaxID=310514 RepID=UPI003610BA1F
MKYFIIVNNAQQGPYDLEELRMRQISSDTLVWAEGMADWTPAWKVEELKPLFYADSTPNPTATPSAPPIPPYDNALTAGNGAPSDEKAPAKSYRKAWTVAGIVAVVVLLVMAMTNPPKDEHKRIIKENITQGLAKLSDDGSGDPFKAIGSTILGTIAMPIINTAIDTMLDYHNYLFWSTTTMKLSDDREVRTSFGIFGKVFSADETDVAQAVSKLIESHVSESMRSTATDDNSDDSNYSDIDKAANQVADSAMAIGAKVSKHVINQVSSEVSKEMKKEIDQNTDSTTVSGIGKIIDEVEKFLKGL